ncbi:unnamed protein product [Jaminaea pallidilutea]
MSLAHVDVLFFDVFGTVVDWLHTVSDELHSTIKAAPHPDPSIQRQLLAHDWEDFTKQWRAGYMKGTRELAKTGNPEKITVDAMHRTILDRLVAETEHLSEAWDEEVLSRLNLTWHHLRPWPDSVRGLRELKRQFKVGTLTNGNLSLMVDMAKYGDLGWDFILTADLLKTFKPDPQMYRQAMALAGLDIVVEARRAAMVAAHLHDLEAAKAQGMSTVFVRRETEDQIDDPAQVSPYVDVVVGDLEELSRIAGGLPMA